MAQIAEIGVLYSMRLSKLPTVLVVDDDFASQEMSCAVLDMDGFKVFRASNGTEALAVFKKELPDTVLLDMDIKGQSGRSTLQQMKKANPYCSVMLLSEKSQTEAIIDGLEAGADDYIVKPFDPGELLARVRTQSRIQSLAQQLKVANEKLKELVETDDLTGLYNMRSLYQKLNTELARARRYHRSVVVVMMDLDHFKSVNDDNDHLFGSWVLSRVGDLIKKSMRETDFAARYGGDEFLVVLTETDVHGAQTFCERLRNVIASTDFSHEGNHIDLTASIGFAASNAQQPDVDARALVRSADRALYDAKRAGRDCVRYVDLSVEDQSAG
jgi:two-component system cell cycle response regulator